LPIEDEPIDDVIDARDLKKLDSPLFLEMYDESHLEQCKIYGGKRFPPLLPDLNGAEKLQKIVPSNVILKYLDLLDNIIELLQGLNTHQVIDTLSNISASDQCGINYFTATFIEKLRECADTNSLLRILFPFTNWYDHSIIRKLVEACDCPEGIKLLDEFDSRIDLTLPITEYPIPVPSKNLMIPDEFSAHTVMAVRCEQQLSSLTLKHVGVTKLLIMNKFCITKHTCVLLAVANHNSAMLFWLIPRSVAPLISNTVQEHSGFLHDNELLELAIYPNFSFSTGSTSRVWKLVHFSDIDSMYKHVSNLMSLYNDLVLNVVQYVVTFFCKNTINGVLKHCLHNILYTFARHMRI